MRLLIPALLFLEALGEYRCQGMSPAGKVGFPIPASACGHLGLLPTGLNTGVLPSVFRKVVKLWGRSWLPLSTVGTGTYLTDPGQGYA